MHIGNYAWAFYKSYLIFGETIKEGEMYTMDPFKVAAQHTEPWCKNWGAFDEANQLENITYFRKMRNKIHSSCFALAVARQ